MGEPTPPKKVVFRSDMKAASQQATDYFEEQNKKRAEKKQKNAKTRKWVIIISVLVALIVIATVVIVVVFNSRNQGPTISDDAGQDGDVDSALSGAQDLTNQVTEVFEPTYTVNEDGNVVVDGNLENAEATFEAALANPANRDRIDTIYLSQMMFYSSLSDNQRIVDIAAKVNPDKLNTSEKLRFYNLAYLAYAALGDKDQTNRYYNLMRETASKVSGIGG